jgi:uncharacterized protein YggE
MNEIFKSGAGKWVLILLAVFLGISSIGALLNLHYIGTGVTAANTISVSGHGESLAVPDIATFSFSIVSDKPTVAAAQADATAKINAVTDYLTGAGISKNDIQTSDYSVQPQYDYVNNTACSPGVYCPGTQVLKGYEVSQSTTVKVRDTSKAGDLLTGVGSKGATQISSLQFTFDNPTAVQTDARTKAIADAKTKADALAQELGVSLVRVVSFNENGSTGGPVPMYAMASGASDSKAIAPEISTGQNTVTDDVTVTYEIR